MFIKGISAQTIDGRAMKCKLRLLKLVSPPCGLCLFGALLIIMCSETWHGETFHRKGIPPPKNVCLNRQDIAAYMKKEFDNKFGTTWHCVVGRNFGSFVTHGSRSFPHP